MQRVPEAVAPHAADQDGRGELAEEALEDVERQLKLTRERRRRLDRDEASLWARRNGLERLLIHTRGSDWWRARRPKRDEASRVQPEGIP